MADMRSGACSQWALIIRTARGLGSACDQAKSSSIHSGSSNNGGAPWPRKRAGIGPDSGVHSPWVWLEGAVSAKKVSNAAPGWGANIGELMERPSSPSTRWIRG